ncbi:hypothetical protein V495_07192 [Pseudogymnoascus sp. VKM F-4514 (FW-929)]|nr:hypothetical protein V495_07192 [Pseudogymnoascus sp. VKM F-4514 (FW-929)]KFY60116.1 hypothetical protein V497_03856 [Pseudogymnoascus sp. VKM F-4516 (FW-969)]
MEPFTKKRRLAPKVTENPGQDQAQDEQLFEYQASSSLQDAPQPPPQPSPDQADLERFARQLQGAASVIETQNNRLPYNSASVLLLRWEDDLSVADDLLALQKLFRERYNYRTEAWNIPTCPNPTSKLSIQLAQHVEYARPGHLLIIYYVGYSYVGRGNQLYWACNAREDSPKVKWDNIKSPLEDAPSDILLLLDCCAVVEPPVSGSNGLKQVIAAFAPDTAEQDPGPHSFTYHLIDALHKLSSEPPFTAQQLHDELIVSLRHYRSLDHNGLTNGSGKANSTLERTPIFFTLTPNSTGAILLTPVPPTAIGVPHIASPSGAGDGDIPQALTHGEQALQDASRPGMVFEEQRALVSILFHGEPDHEMASFKHWLNSTPATAAKVTVEGRFQGPPTVILISMPLDVYNAIAQDKQCILLGYIKSHNLLREYQSLVDLTAIANHASSKHLEDGKILLEAADALAAASSPGVGRNDSLAGSSSNITYQHGHQSPHSLPPPPPLSMSAPPEPGLIPEQKDHVEDSDEMHEAAIQLKALSHVRPVSHDSKRQDRGASNIPVGDSPRFHSPRQHSISSHDGAESGMEDNIYSSEYNSPASRPKARRSSQKAGPKQDTRCNMCSHAPFKDSSSLRKHIAAAHTRPFPCAFSFAGCTSTFGSKNEWKRHIASQHLCLTFYRCSSCPQSTVEGKGNEFNRKDLFTQHLRRMHAPFAIKKALAKGDSKLQVEWETHVKDMQASCLVIRRSPPQRSACPKADCSNVFEGTGSWDDWTEHVGRHMEKGEAGRLGVDKLLARWALDEGIIERREDGEYRLCGAEREGGNGGGYYSDSAAAKRDEGDKMEEAIMMADEALR